jgi:hypothetical protein
MGLTVHTGDGGFYHWLELPEGLNAGELNRRLFHRGAAILRGLDCDMARPHAKDPDYVSPYDSFFRFSFGPLLPETFESDIAIMKQVLDEYLAAGSAAPVRLRGDLQDAGPQRLPRGLRRWPRGGAGARRRPSAQQNPRRPARYAARVPGELTSTDVLPASAG